MRDGSAEGVGESDRETQVVTTAIGDVGWAYTNAEDGNKR